MTVDLDRVAIMASETLVKYHITTAPIIPLPILNAIPNVFVVSFTEMADSTGLDRKDLVTMFGAENQDAVTLVKEIKGKTKYFIAYNQRLPFYMLQRSLARELGHIILGHDGSKPEDVSMAEALYFARYLLCPRPLIKAIMDSGIPLTIEVVGNLTGCYGRFLAGLRSTPGAHVPVELNRKVRQQFDDYIHNVLDYQMVMSQEDDSSLANFGSYMEGYED